MRVPHHWSKKGQRYRLEGVQYKDGRVSMMSRPALNKTEKDNVETQEAQVVAEKVYAA